MELKKSDPSISLPFTFQGGNIFTVNYFPPHSSSSSGARSGTDIGDHASPNISVIRQLQKI